MMELLALLAFMTVLPSMTQASCADVTNCPTEFTTATGVDCTKLKGYLDCVKAAQCPEIASSIVSLDQSYQLACNSSNPVNNQGSELLSMFGSMGSFSSISSSCSMLIECTQGMDMSNLDVSRLASGDFSQMCQMLKPVMDCWNQARMSCELPANLTSMMDKSKTMVSQLCSGSGGLADMISKMMTGAGTGLEGCGDFIKCYFKGLPTKNGQIDLGAMQRIQQDQAAMCRLYSTMFSCVENDSGCKMAQDMKPKLNMMKQQLQSMCGQFSTAGSLTTWTLLVYLLAAFVVVLQF